MIKLILSSSKKFRSISTLSKEQASLQIKNTKNLIEFLANHQENPSHNSIKSLEDIPKVPTELPVAPIAFEKVLETIEKLFYVKDPRPYYPKISWESLQGEILIKTFGSLNFTKFSCPIGNDLEICVSDWLAEMLDLPKYFYHSIGPGGGLTYENQSDCLLTVMACARLRKPGLKHIVYIPDRAPFLARKSAKVLGIEYRVIPNLYDPAVQNYPISIQKLKDQIFIDKKDGYTPTFVCGIIGNSILGTTDDIKSIGEISQLEDMWFHVDASYGGNFFALPELRQKLQGVDLATSISINTSTMMNSGYSTNSIWVKDSRYLTNVLTQNANYLSTHRDMDFKNWQIPLGRDVKALKLWFFIQQRGVLKIQDDLRRQIDAGKLMEKLVVDHGDLELVTRRDYSLVNFRVKGNNERTDKILDSLAKDEISILIGSRIDGKSFINFSPTSCFEEFSSIEEIFKVIKYYLD